jgi:hypothetical protein
MINESPSYKMPLYSAYLASIENKDIISASKPTLAIEELLEDAVAFEKKIERAIMIRGKEGPRYQEFKRLERKMNKLKKSLYPNYHRMTNTICLN